MDVDPALDFQVRFAWRAVVDLLGERPSPALLLLGRAHDRTASSGGKSRGVVGVVLLADPHVRPYESVRRDRWDTVFHETVHVWVGNSRKECWEEGLASAISWILAHRYDVPRDRLDAWYMSLAEPMHEVLVAYDGYRFVKPALHWSGCEGPSFQACFDVDRFIAQFPEPGRGEVRQRLAAGHAEAVTLARRDGRRTGYCPAPR